MTGDGSWPQRADAASLTKHVRSGAIGGVMAPEPKAEAQTILYFFARAWQRNQLRCFTKTCNRLAPNVGRCDGRREAGGLWKRASESATHRHACASRCIEGVRAAPADVRARWRHSPFPGESVESCVCACVARARTRVAHARRARGHECVRVASHAAVHPHVHECCAGECDHLRHAGFECIWEGARTCGHARMRMCWRAHARRTRFWMRDRGTRMAHAHGARMACPWRAHAYARVGRPMRVG